MKKWYVIFQDVFQYSSLSGQCNIPMLIIIAKSALILLMVT